MTRIERGLVDLVDVYILLPCAHPLHQILQTTVILQLFASHTAARLGCKIDRPQPREERDRGMTPS